MRNCVQGLVRFATAIAICGYCGARIGSFLTVSLVAQDQPQPQSVLFEPEGTLVGTGERFVQDPPIRTSRRLAIPSRRDIYKRGNSLMLQSFEGLVADSIKSTVRLSVRNRQIALGAVVAADGWIVTKASQLPGEAERAAGQVVMCTLYDGSDFTTTVEEIVRDSDIALLHIDSARLTPVKWARAKPRRGNWLATTDLYSTPAAVGVTSSGLQSVEKSLAVLGVVLENSPKGAVVEQVLPTSGAADAGLQKGDTIYSLNGKQISTPGEFRNLVAGSYGGDPLDLGVSRGKRQLRITARLMDLSDELLDETEMEVSGQVSHRSTGFSSVFLHDTVLLPNQCGGPIVDLDGNVAGINIARAGRVHSYALPASVVQPLVKQLVEQARLVSRSPESSGSAF